MMAARRTEGRGLLAARWTEGCPGHYVIAMVIEDRRSMALGELVIGKRPSACADGSKTDGGPRIDGGKTDGWPRALCFRLPPVTTAFCKMRWLGGGLWGRVAHHELAHG